MPTTRPSAVVSLSTESADPTASPLVKFERTAARKRLGVRQREARAIRFKGDISDPDTPASGVCLAHLLKACRREGMEWTRI